MGKLKKSIGDTSRIVRYMWYAFGGIVVLVVAAFAMIAWGWIGYMPPIEDMENPKDKFASEIYSSDMEVIGRFYQSKSNRVYVHYFKRVREEEVRLPNSWLNSFILLMPIMWWNGCSRSRRNGL